MPALISTSLTKADTRTYIYPRDVVYVMDAPNDDDILYVLNLVPPEPR
jgi:hypothetical protein